MPKQTRGWDDVANVTRGQRHKEESSDYRYFPDPDLVPVTVAAAKAETIRAALGELPAALRRRMERTHGITPYDSDVLVNQGQELVDYFVALADQVRDGKLASNWTQQDVLRILKDESIDIAEFARRMPVARLAELLSAVKEGLVDTSRARELLVEMLSTGRSAAEVIQAHGIVKVDESDLFALAQQLLVGNPKIVADIQAGKLQAAGNLIGQAKKQNPNVSPGRFREIVIELAGKMGG